VREEDIIRLDMPVEDAVKMVISVGIVEPPHIGSKVDQPTPVLVSRNED